jgi:uncharacterized membrane protein YdjX (TVP38/TMEM64 family)
MKNKIKKIFVFLLLIVVAFSIIYFREILTEKILELEQYVEKMPVVIGFFVFLIQTISVSVGLPGLPMTLVAGSFFGLLWGTVIGVLASTIGGLVAFYFSRYLLRNFVKRKIIEKNPKIIKYEDSLDKNSIGTIFFLRLMPISPYNVINFFMGATKVSWQKFILGSFLGMIPGTFMLVYLGDSISTFNPKVNIF